ncbi:MAG: zinc ribbon domain-containing protein [Chloroflexi bacterium]|nr:zinc ribbon domain-containing protein [Chloroflexota bacterium]
MDFLEDLFDLGDRKRKKQGGILGQNDHHDDHHDHDEHHDDDHRHNNPGYPPNPAMPQTGLFCTRCTAQLASGAKFCHQCGAVVEVSTNCASCGSKLPPGAKFCPQCGYKPG